MGTLKFRDNIAEVATCKFNDVVNGTAFEYDERLFIKVNDFYAFDVCNLTLRDFRLSDDIIEREAEIIFN